MYAHEKSRHYARDTLLRLQRAWAEKQFRLVNFILNVPYQEPQPERFRRPTSGRQRAAKLEYISKDSGTFVLSGKALNDAGAFGLSVDSGSRSQQGRAPTYLPGPFMSLRLFPSFLGRESGIEIHCQLLFSGGNLSYSSPSHKVLWGEEYFA